VKSKPFFLYFQVLKNEQRIDGSIFRGLVSLNKLTITRCKSVKRLEQTTFQYIPNVEYVDCSENSISSIEPGAFNVPSKLRHLNLTENLLEKCPSLNELRNLESLVLYENRINSLYGLFEGCEGVNMNLRLLDLGQNALSSLPDNAFSSLPSLITLNLRINPISRIARGAFTDLVNLRVLDLSYTCFNEIVIDIFSSSSYLENLRVLKCNGACLESCTGRSKESLVGFRHEVFVEAVSNYDSSFTILSDLFCKA
jgi:Leucine-rich repeat (LRR) protein